jgi:hypothetical protein
MNNYMQKEQSLRQIVPMLLLNGTLTECPGLVHGKMGIATFIFYYVQYAVAEQLIVFTFLLEFQNIFRIIAANIIFSRHEKLERSFF